MWKVIRRSLPTLFVVGIALFCSWWARPQTGINPNTPSSLQILFLPYYSIEGDWRSRLTLNNSSAHSLTASVTVYSLDGSALALPDFRLSSTQSISLLLNDLLRQANGKKNFQEGSIELRFGGAARELAPQLTIYDSKHGLSFDVEPAGNFKSSTLEGLWWSLPNEQAFGEDEETSGQVMLANTTNQDIRVLLNLEWRGGVIPGPPISMSRHQTVVIEIDKLLDRLNIHRQGIERGGLSLSHNGSPGALIAHGVILNKSRRFASNLNFVDPAAQTSSVLEATGLLLSHPDPGLPFSSASFFSPILALKNASSSTQTATVTVQYTASGVFQTETLPAIALAPHDVHLADFSSLLDSSRNVSVLSGGLKVEFSGKPGSLIAALSSIDGFGSMVVDAPLFNVDPAAYHAGNHPFRIDSNSQTMANVKNVGTSPTAALLVVRYPGGEYTPPLLKLAPGETFALNLRALRDSRAKDVRGRTLPQDLTEGQFIWYPHGKEALIGRTVLVDTSAGTSSNFSCPACCGTSFDHLEVSPLSISGPTGSSQQMLVNEFDRGNCTGTLLGPYDVTLQCQYSSDNPSVATVGFSGLVSLQAVGSATITMSFNAFDTRFNGFDCSMIGFPVSASCPVTVQCRPSLSATNETGKNCDGTTIYHAGFTIGGFDYPHVTRIQLSTSTDNGIVIELLGGPYNDTSGLCPTSIQACFKQDYKAHAYPPSPSGNIIWNVTIWCDNHTTPDLQTTVNQRVSCQ